jgi:hypothetical protein
MPIGGLKFSSPGERTDQASHFPVRNGVTQGTPKSRTGSRFSGLLFSLLSADSKGTAQTLAITHISDQP